MSDSGGSDINKGRSKKWKKILQFPHISYCIDLKDRIDCSYAFIVEHQPIGRSLFRQFCETNPFYNKCNTFLDAVDSLEVQLDQNQVVVAQDIIDKFLTKKSIDFVDVVSEETVARSTSRLKENSKSRDVFTDCTK